MANETITTVVGNLTADPELRFTPSGAAVANFTVAATPRMLGTPMARFGSTAAATARSTPRCT